MEIDWFWLQPCLVALTHFWEFGGVMFFFDGVLVAIK